MVGSIVPLQVGGHTVRKGKIAMRVLRDTLRAQNRGDIDAFWGWLLAERRFTDYGHSGEAYVKQSNQSINQSTSLHLFSFCRSSFFGISVSLPVLLPSSSICFSPPPPLSGFSQ